MTLNAVINRVKAIALAHKQVRRFAYTEGSIGDLTVDKTDLYPAIFLQGNTGAISVGQHRTTLDFKIWFVDLVNVAQDTQSNLTDVSSDMVSIAQDILAQMNHGGYSDWRISSDNNFELFVAESGDMFGGCSVDISITTKYAQNVCEVPTLLQTYTATSGTRMRVTVNEDLVSGELTLLFSKLPVEYNVPTDQDIVITDFLKGVVLKASTGSNVRLTANEVNGELSLTLTKI